MNTNEILIATAAAAVGGTIGAVGTAFLSWTKIAANFNDLKSALATRDPQKIAQAGHDLLDDLGAFATALMKLRGALRIR
jgi:hypothetical protein